VLCDPLVHFGGLSSLYFNAVPRFVDVKYETFNMDPASLRANISPRSKAVIVTHFWGQCAEIEEIAAICKEHNLVLIEDCAHAIGATWKGQHAGTWGDLGVFSFQQGKHMTTGDGGMLTTNRTDLYEKIYGEWAFSGESPAFLTLNYRMNEVTGAVGLGQVARVRDYVAEYTRSRVALDEAIVGCRWLMPRRIPPAAHHVGYIWVCIWEGDKQGLSLNDFKRLCKEENLRLGFGFTQTPAYTYDIFKVSTAYGVPDCPVRCPFYTQHSDYRYRPGLCPAAEELLPRLVTTGLIEVPREEITRRVESLRRVIRRMEG
jgi:dTDP-4-amino-4,6-dideoxygalactose transaminase